MIPAIILREAEIEFREAVAYYEEKNPGLGLDFAAEVKRTIDAIRRFPESCRLRDDGTRRCLTHRFPYLIVYSYLSGHISVIAFAHCRRQPEYWQRRLTTDEPGDSL